MSTGTWWTVFVININMSDATLYSIASIGNHYAANLTNMSSISALHNAADKQCANLGTKMCMVYWGTPAHAMTGFYYELTKLLKRLCYESNAFVLEFNHLLPLFCTAHETYVSWGGHMRSSVPFYLTRRLKNSDKVFGVDKLCQHQICTCSNKTEDWDVKHKRTPLVSLYIQVHLPLKCRNCFK